MREIVQTLLTLVLIVFLLLHAKKHTRSAWANVVLVVAVIAASAGAYMYLR